MTEIFVPLTKLRIVDDPRNSDREDTTDLQQTISSEGLLVPLSVYDLEDGTYEIGSGTRRYRALKALKRLKITVPGLEYNKIPCLLVDRPETPLLTKAAANVQKPLLPSQIGEVLIIQMQQGKSLIDAANSLALSIGKAEVLINLRQDDIAIQRKVDKGEIAITTYKRRLMSATKEVKDEVAQIEGKVTQDRVKTISKNAKQSGRVAVVESNDYVPRLNEAHELIQEVLGDSRSGARENHVLQKIFSTLLEVNGGQSD